MTDIESNWPFERLRPNEQDAIYDLLVAVESELDRVDVQADELQEQRFLNTATTHELAKLAAEVGVARETGESEERFRFRARVNKFIMRSRGTTPEFAQLLKGIFGEDVSNVRIDPIDGEPAVRLTIPSIMIEELPVSQSRLQSMLTDAIPASDGIDIVTDETFLLGKSGSQGLGEGELS